MKANELRIGNLVKHVDSDSIFKVTGIHEFGLDCESKDESTYMEYENFEPVQLTPEYHKKLGAYTVVELNYYRYTLPRKNNSRLTVNFKGYGIDLHQYLTDRTDQDLEVINIWDFNLTKREMYVHEWQNLYFILTGEELTYGGNK